MLSKFISAGAKIEMQAVERSFNEQGEQTAAKVYYSQVHEILSDDTMEITMPMEQTKLILLPMNGEFDMVLRQANVMYQCFVRVIDRYKSNNTYLLVVELTSNLRKYQRREYYRLSCSLEMRARNLQEEELQAMKNHLPYALTPGLPLKRSVIVDISGGGLRFLSSQRYEPGSMLYINYHLLKNGVDRPYELIGKVIAVRELENKPGTFEHRVQYCDVDREVREEIIRYIFEEERKNRRKELFFNGQKNSGS